MLDFLVKLFTIIVGAALILMGIGFLMTESQVTGIVFTSIGGLALIGSLMPRANALAKAGQSMLPDNVGMEDAAPSEVDESLTRLETRWVVHDEFRTKVFGVRSYNADGSSRQKILKKCNLATPVELRLERVIKDDFQEILIVTPRGTIGVVPIEDSGEVWTKFNSGETKYSAKLFRVDSFVNEEKETIWFAQIDITEYKPEEIRVRSTTKSLTNQAGKTAVAGLNQSQKAAAITGAAISASATWGLPRLKSASLRTAKLVDETLERLAGKDIFVHWVFRCLVVFVAWILFIVFLSSFTQSEIN